MGGNGHALEQAEGVAFHQHAVSKRAAVAFIGVHANVFVGGCVLGFARMGSRRLIGHRAPLNARREARTAAAAQAGIGHRLHHITATHGEGVFEAGQATMGHIVFWVDRVGNAHPLVNPTVLLGEVLDLFYRTDKVIGLLIGQAGIDLPCAHV